MLIEDVFNKKAAVRLGSDSRPRPSFHSKLYRVIIGDLTIWYSFKTPIAIQHTSLYHTIFKKFPFEDKPKTRTTSRYVCDNFWGKHTAYHLNYLDDKHTDSRVSKEFIMKKIVELVPIEILKTTFDFRDGEIYQQHVGLPELL